MQSRTVTVGEQFYSIEWMCPRCAEWHQETCADDRRGARQLREIFVQLLNMGTEEIRVTRVRVYRFTGPSPEGLRGYQTVEDVTVDVNVRVVKKMLAEVEASIAAQLKELPGWNF